MPDCIAVKSENEEKKTDEMYERPGATNIKSEMIQNHKLPPKYFRDFFIPAPFDELNRNKA